MTLLLVVSLKGRVADNAGTPPLRSLEETTMTASAQAFKAQARRLRAALSDEAIPLGHRKTLDLIARVHGWRDWNTLSAALDKGRALPSGHAPGPQEDPHMTTPNSGARPQYLKTTFIDVNLTATFDTLPTAIGGWTRRPDLEPEDGHLGLTQRYYTRSDGKRPLLAIDFDRDKPVAKIVNILPGEGEADISLNEANTLEQDFVTALRPLLPSTVKIRQNAPTVHLRNLLTAATYDLFRYHSANKTTGNSHSHDRGHWLNFIKAAAAEGLDDRDEHKDLVRGALLEEGFAERHAKQIADDYVRHMEMAHAMM